MVSYSVAWHPCLQPAIMASAGWSGFDTLEPARWVWRHGSDDSRIGGWPRQYQRAALRSVQYKGEE